MGYYTTFELRVQNKEQDTPENVQAIQDAIIEQESDNRHVFDNDGQSVWSDGGIKWYEYTEHLIEISKKLPNLVIQVDGEGEEVGDIWRAFWKDGLVQEVKRTVIVEDFDEKKLKKLE